MVFICNICEEKAIYRISLDCGKFNNNLFYCEKHKPKSIIVSKMDKKQSSDESNVLIKNEVLK